MEMTYGGALVMPSSYAVFDEEEMMYLEGGAYWFDFDVNQVAYMIDVYIFCITGGVGALKGSVKSLIGKHGKAFVVDVMKIIAMVLGVDTPKGVIEKFLADVTGVSLSLGIALILDACDDTRTNLRVQFSSCNPYIYT